MNSSPLLIKSKEVAIEIIKICNTVKQAKNVVWHLLIFEVHCLCDF